MATAIKWTPAKIKRAKETLGKFTNKKEALPEVIKAVGFMCTWNSLNLALDGAFKFLKKPVLPKMFAYKAGFGGNAVGSQITSLVELVKRPIAFVDLCDKMNLSPRRTQELILQARADGVKVHVENDHVGLKLSEPIEQVQTTKISPVVGQRQKVAVISDTHLGSKYCLREQLKDFIHYAYKQGVREILHVGDALDGDYRHGKFEMTHMGISEQTRDLFETLPQLPGLTYHGVTGNHDETFTSESGIDAGEFIESYFKKRGRKDFTFYGNRGAFLKIRGAVVHLWHPRSGGSYAVSYGIQKKIESYSSIKPSVLLIGHWHKHATVYERGVHGIACPTFQAGRSAFSKSLTGAPAIGGLVLSWDVTKDGTLRSFVIEMRAYFENERPLDVYNSLDAIAVEPEEQLVEIRAMAGKTRKK